MVGGGLDFAVLIHTFELINLLIKLNYILILANYDTFGTHLCLDRVIPIQVNPLNLKFLNQTIPWLKFEANRSRGRTYIHPNRVYYFKCIDIDFCFMFLAHTGLPSKDKTSETTLQSLYCALQSVYCAFPHTSDSYTFLYV